MPAQRPRASFEPIAPDFDLGKLVENNDNFRYVDRISCEQIDIQGLAALEKLILLHVVIGGKPLVIDSYQNKLDPWTFTPKWLRDNVGEKVEQSRNLGSKEYLPLTIGHYLKNMGLLANQYFENNRNYKDKGRQRIYLKDIDCPQVWHDKLAEVIPGSLFYWNESTGEYGGPGATVDPTSSVPGRRMGRGIARAGDLMSSLPVDMRAENMMCYIGHEGTYTPAHREMCATLGHNIMVEASGDVGEDGKPEKPGSSIWFMTESKDRATVSEYWLSVLGHDIEVETHFAQVSAWRKAPFTVYVVEQKPGDLILIPPLAPHQVWNRGTRTMKAAWNRTTVETLEMAIQEALPKARIVCRDEQYKNKTIIYYTLLKYSGLLSSAKQQADRQPNPEAGWQLLYSPKIRQLQKDFKRLLVLYRDVLLSEMFSPDGPQEKCEFLPFDSNVTCAYCRGNIFNRFLSCPTCTDALGHEEEEPYDVCMDCYAMGRSCGCISNLKWMEQFKWKELVQRYEHFRKQILDLEGNVVNENTLLPLTEERKKYPKKTLAEVCKEQLKRRPWIDIKKPKEEQEGQEESEEEIVVDDEGRVKKTVKKRSKTWLKNNSACHVCCHRHPNWKMAKCTNCERMWCYGSLFRGYDAMPFAIMEDPYWTCPHCLGICFVGACRKDPRQKPYQPKGTLLGHDTKKVADVRSVEALVDFSVSNLNWLRDDENAAESARLRRAREEAEAAKEGASGELDEQHYVEQDHMDETHIDESQVQFEYSPDATPAIDPRLGARSNAAVDPVLDPALDPALQDESDLARALAQQVDLPPPAAMLRGARPPRNSSPLIVNGAPEGYAPATTSGFMAPPAPMYPDPSAGDGYQYPDPTEGRANGDEDIIGFNPHDSISDAFVPPDNSRGKKRKADPDDIISMTVPRKRRVTENGGAAAAAADPRLEATKEFQFQKQRKALELAKKEGRFVAVQAAMRGKKKLVRLKVPGARLAQILAMQAAKAATRPPEAAAGGQRDPEDGEAEDTVLLTSDVAKPKPSYKKPSENLNKIRVPVERDEDFGARTDRRPRADGRRPGRPKPQYEEVDVATDDEDEAGAGANTTQMNGNGNGDGGGRRKGRRISKYLQRKHQDDPDLPDELPTVRPSKPRSRPVSTKAGAGAGAAGKRPAVRPKATTHTDGAIELSDGASSSEDEDADEDADGEDVVAGSSRPASRPTSHPPSRSPRVPSLLSTALTTNGRKATPKPTPKATPKATPTPASTARLAAEAKRIAAAAAAAAAEEELRRQAEEEENRRAKLAALKMFEDEIASASNSRNASPAVL